MSDLRIAARGLVKARAFSIAVIVTLALGTGAATAMFSVLRATLLRPPPFPDPGRLALISVSQPSTSPPRQGGLSNLTFELLRQQAKSFESVAAYANPHVNVSGYDQAERITAEVVSADYFTLLRVLPQSGRGFRADEDSVTSAAPVVVIGHGLWVRRFGADPAIVGKQLLLNRISLQIIGVMPPGFHGLSGEADLWIPRAMAAAVVFPYRSYSVVARLRPGRTLAQAASELQVLQARIATSFPETTPAGAPPRVMRVTPLSDARIDASARGPVLILFGAVGMLLLIACANIANLLLVRVHAREREVAVRLAVGSSPWRLARLLLAESLVLGALGGATGLIVAYAAIRVVRPLMPARAPGGPFLSVGDFATPHFDFTVLAFSWAVIAATAILFGLAPALRAARTRPVDALKAGGAGTGSSWRALGLDPYAVLSVGEIALAVVLLAGSGLLLRSLWRLESLPLGFDTANRVSFQIQAPSQWVPPVQVPVLVERVVDAVARVPGVSAAAASYYGPFDPGARHEVRFLGASEHPEKADRMAGHHYVTPGYFETLGIPVLRGRPFTPADRVGQQPVAIVSEGAARRLWPRMDPLGKRFFLGGRASAPPDSAVEVVGVVRDVRYRPTPYRVEPDVYTPYYQFPSIVWALIIVRSETPATRLIPALREAVRGVDPDLPISEAGTLEHRGGNQLARRRLNAVLLTIFAGLALVIATIGVYGVIAHQTAQRTGEFGIRIAVGAAPQDIVRGVLARAVVLIGAGLLIGMSGALALTRVLTSQLYEIRATDFWSYLMSGGVLSAAAVIASYLPARRAAKVEPLVALRAE